MEFDNVVCPGCGLITTIDNLDNGACPDCEYENGEEPFRLLTLSEMLEDYNCSYNDVNMARFLTSIISIIIKNGAMMKLRS